MSDQEMINALKLCVMALKDSKVASSDQRNQNFIAISSAESIIAGWNVRPATEVPNVPELLDVIFANDGGTIETEGPVPMRIAKAIHALLIQRQGGR